MDECVFWYWLTRVAPDKIQIAVKQVCVYVCVCLLHISVYWKLVTSALDGIV